MKNFYTFGLPTSLVQSLDRLNLKIPTPIQEATLPASLSGRDIIGSAQTGTGKTVAFSIPLITKLLCDERSSALVVAPTRELATQVSSVLQSLLGKNSSIKVSLLIGGDSMAKQLHQLKAKPRIFIGTPGRINDHLERGNLNFQLVNFLVLDEIDRMLDMGFCIQIDKIIKELPKQRQTLMFSATVPRNIIKIANSYLHKPEHISIGSGSIANIKIKQDIVHIGEAEKYQELLNQLQLRSGSILIFVKTKIGAERIAKRLRSENHQTDAIHGDLRHSKRESVIRAFRNNKCRILVATDIAARGLDIPHIEHVINFDLPQCPEDYIHRIGRTARAGAKGESLCLITPHDRVKWNAINRLLNPEDKTIVIPNRSNNKQNCSKQKQFGFKKSFRNGSKKRKSNSTRHVRIA